MQEGGGYLAATIGAFVGAVVAGLAGYGVAAVYTWYALKTHDYSRGGEPFLLPLFLLIVAIGVVVGEGVGCWIALKAWEYSSAFVTAVLLPVLLVLSIAGVVLWAIGNDDLSVLWLIPVCFLVMPVVARALVNVAVPESD